MVCCSLYYVDDEIILAYHFLNSVTTHDKLAEIVFESFAVEIFGEVGRLEILHLCLVFAMDEDYLWFVFLLFLDASVEGDAVYPVCEVSLWDVSSYHSLEIDYQVKGDFIHVVSIHDDDILAPMF